LLQAQEEPPVHVPPEQAFRELPPAKRS
jgi:hypothetical protein